MWVVQLRRRCASISGAGLVTLVFWVGCSASSDSLGERGADGPSQNAGGGRANSGPAPATAGTSSGSVPELEPEEEKESSFKLPVLSGRWVWSANPESGRVSVIDTRSLSVQLATAGFAPTYLAALPVEGEVLSAAIVLNRRSQDATLLRLTEGGMKSSTVPTHAGANSWALSASGRWAIAWTDAEVTPGADRVQSFQEVTVIDTTAPTSKRLGVGYRPSRVFIQADEARAFVVCQPGISVIELDSRAPRVSRDIALSGDPSAPVIDVTVVPDGSHAIARVEGEREVRIVELLTGIQTRVTLSSPVTDLDLVADGSAAVAVARGRPLAAGGSGGRAGGEGGMGEFAGGAGPGGETGSPPEGGQGAQGGSSGESSEGGGQSTLAESGGSGDAGRGASAGAAGSASGPGAPGPTGYGSSEIVVLPIPGVVSNPLGYRSVFVPELVGSVAVSDRGTIAVLYTTAAAVDRVVLLPTASSLSNAPAARSVSMRGPVESVFVSPDSEHAIVTLQRTAESTVRGAFGVIPLGLTLPVKFQITDAPVTGVAFAPSPSKSAILTAATGRSAYVVHMPSLLVDSVALPSLPLSAGIIPEEKSAFVVQRHPEGRLSLIGLETAEERTLTGFELAAGVTR